MVTQQEGIEDYLLRNLLVKMKTGEISSFPELFTDFIFAGGSAIPNHELLEYLKYLFDITAKKLKDNLALATLNKIRSTYYIIEEEAEGKKEWQQKHLGNALKRANENFFEFIVSAYPTIAWKKPDRLSENKFETVMQKTRFQILEYVSRQWVQEMTDKSCAAFRFLIKALSQENKEVLDKIFRPRVEKWFTNVEHIEKWIMASRREFVPYEIQQLLAMARAKIGGPELAKQDIANSMAVKEGK